MNLNLVQICGRLTKDPESRKTPTGTTVASFSIATNRVYVKDNQKIEETEYHNVSAFGNMAENIEKYFKKGDEIYIQGRLKTSSWEGKDGVKKYNTGVIAERFDFGRKAAGNVRQEATQEEPEENDDEEIRVEDIPF